MAREPDGDAILATLRALGRRLGTDRASAVAALVLGLVATSLGVTAAMPWLVVFGAAWLLFVDELWTVHRRHRMRVERLDGAWQKLLHSALVFALPLLVAWVASTRLGTQPVGTPGVFELLYMGLALILIVHDLLRLHVDGRPGGVDDDGRAEFVSWSELIAPTLGNAALGLGMVVFVAFMGNL